MKQFLPSVLVAISFTGCCSYERGPRHVHSTPLPAPVHPPYAQLPANPPPIRPDYPPPSPLPTPPSTLPTPPSYSTNIVAGDGETRLELKTQDWTVDKMSVSAGVARIRKWIVTEDKSSPITVCHDEIKVEREPANGASTAPFFESDGYIEVPLSKEVATGVTRTRVYEILKIRKSRICETNVITGTVKTEKAAVVQ